MWQEREKTLILAGALLGAVLTAGCTMTAGNAGPARAAVDKAAIEVAAEAGRKPAEAAGANADKKAQGAAAVDKPAPEKAAPAEAGTQPPREKPKEKPLTAKQLAEQKGKAQAGEVVIAAEDLSNLQLSSPSVPVYDKLFLWDRMERGLPLSLSGLRPYYNGKTAYLTFDDGPDDENTPAILDILKQEGVPATFYLVGTSVETYPEVVKRIYNEHHAIGNHTYNHHYDYLYSSLDNFVYQLELTDKAIHKIIGVRPLIVRAPGGAAGSFEEWWWDKLDGYGYSARDWNVSSQDATGEPVTAQDLVNNVDAQTDDGKESAIVLMHSSSGHEATVQALPGIIRVLRSKGYHFGVVTPMTPEPW